METVTYVDEKGRTRWRRNDEVSAVVKQLGEYLIIGGYPVEHAKRYAQLAHTISRLPDSIDQLADAGQLDKIHRIGGVITGYLTEIVKTGTTENSMTISMAPPPRTVLGFVAIDRLGPKDGSHPVSGPWHRQPVKPVYGIENRKAGSCKRVWPENAGDDSGVVRRFSDG